MQPVNWLSERNNLSRLGRLLSSGGIVPVSWFLLKNNSFRLVRLPNSDGMEPVSSLSLSGSTCKLFNLLNSGGTVLVNRLPRNERSVSSTRLPISGGMWPERLFSSRSSLVARPSSSVVTPYHSFKGASVSQLVLFRQLSPPPAL